MALGGFLETCRGWIVLWLGSVSWISSVRAVSSFASSLIAAHLVDVFHLVVHPDILGNGLPIFAGLSKPLHLKLEDLKQFDTGLVVKTYKPCYNK